MQLTARRLQRPAGSGGDRRTGLKAVPPACFNPAMAMIDECEFLIVMEEGADTRVLARLEHLALARPAWMAAVTQWPNENLQLRRRAQIIKRHDGKPKPEPDMPDMSLPDWDIGVIRGSRTAFLGIVIAARDEEDARRRAIEQFKLNPEQIKRLVIRQRRR